MADPFGWCAFVRLDDQPNILNPKHEHKIKRTSKFLWSIVSACIYSTLEIFEIRLKLEEFMFSSSIDLIMRMKKYFAVKLVSRVLYRY